MYISVDSKSTANQRAEVFFSSFFAGGFITAIVVNPPERKLAKRTSVQRLEMAKLRKATKTRNSLCVVENKKKVVL